MLEARADFPQHFFLGGCSLLFPVPVIANGFGSLMAGLLQVAR